MRAKFPFECPACHHTGRARVELLGRPVSCKSCGSIFTMPRHLRLPCPSCRKVVRVSQKHLDRLVNCMFCEHLFKAALADAVSEAPHSVAAIAGRSGSKPEGPPGNGVDPSDRAAARLVEAAADRRTGGAWPGRVERLEPEIADLGDRPGRACKEQVSAAALLVEPRASRSEFEAHRSEAEGSARRLAEELESIRAERDRLEGRCLADAAQAEQLRADGEENRRLLGEAMASHRAELEELIRRQDGERSGWAEEQFALGARDRDECEMLRGELERLRSSEDERQGEVERLADLRTAFERERQALTERSEQLRHEIESRDRDHRQALERIDELGREASRLADRRAVEDAAHLEELGRLRGEYDVRQGELELALNRIVELERRGSHLADERARQEEERQDEIRRLRREVEPSREVRERALGRGQELERELERLADERGREVDRHRGETEGLLRQIEALRGDLDSTREQVASVRGDRERAGEEWDAEVGRLRREIEAGGAELEVAQRRIEELQRERVRSEAEAQAELDRLREQMGRLDTDHEASRAAEQEARRRSDDLAADRDRLRAERDRSEQDRQAAEQRSREELDPLVQQLNQAREEATQHARRAEALSMQHQRLTSEVDDLRTTHESELRKTREQLQIALEQLKSTAADRPRTATEATGLGATDGAPSAPGVAQNAKSNPPPAAQATADYRDLALGQWNSERFKQFLQKRSAAKPNTSSTTIPHPSGT